MNYLKSDRNFLNIPGSVRAMLRRCYITGNEQKGFGLVESLIAVAILGSAVFMLLGSLGTGSLAVGIQDEDIISENIARTQLEYTKSLSYQPAPYSYPAITELPVDYSVTAEASGIPSKDLNIQKITVTVSRNGSVVYILEGYKVNR